MKNLYIIESGIFDDSVKIIKEEVENEEDIEEIADFDTYDNTISILNEVQFKKLKKEIKVR